MEISEYNYRQINLMKEIIVQYQVGAIRIDQLISDLESLLNCLENINEEWKNSFCTAWEELEILYAFALYENKKELTDEEIKTVFNVIKKIESLINELTLPIGKNKGLVK